jgi:signal transduction histidine kinase
MAHEINTPLGNARMAASAMTEQGESLRRQLADNQLRRSELQTLLDQQVLGGALLDRAIRQISELVQRFKSLAGAQRQEPAHRFDLRPLLERAAQQWQDRLQGGGVAMRLELPAALEMTGFPLALVEVFDLLLDNCMVHAYARRGGTIVVAALRDGPEVIIDWRDDGSGVDPEHLGRVFEPFFTTQLGRTGAGLGLASAHGMVVDLMRGRINLTSPPGGGTLVQLRLPQGEDG